MKMNKILLSAALLISANAFAMEQSVVKNGFFTRAKASLNSLFSKGSNVAKTAWAKVPSMPANVTAKLATARTFAAAKYGTASNWVKNTAPVVGNAVKTALTSRNGKIAGVALVSLATVGTCAYLYGHKALEAGKNAFVIGKMFGSALYEKCKDKLSSKKPVATK